MNKHLNSLFIMVFVTVSLWSQTVTDSLLFQLKQTTSDTLKINLYIELGNKLSYENPEKALIYYNQSIQIAKNYRNSDFIGKSYKAIGSFYYEKSDYEEALSNFKLAQIYFEKANNQRESGRAFMNIGNVYLSQNIDSKAYEYFLKALRIAEKSNYLKGISAAYNNIGLIYKERHNAIKAIDFYNKSLQIATQLNDKIGVSSTLTNIGNVYADEKKYNLAIDYYNKSLKIDTELNDKFGIVICYNNIGEVYAKQGLYSNAKQYYNNGIDLAQEIGNKSMLAMLYLNLSNLNLKELQLEEAYDNAMLSLKYAKLTNEIKAQSQVYELFSEIAVAQNNYKKALEFQKLFKKFNDSVSSIDRLMKIKELDVIFDADDKNKELQYLADSNKQNEIQITNQKILIYGFVFVIFIVILFSGILFKQNQDKVKMNSLLMLKGIQIEEKNKEIVNQHKDLEELNDTKDRFFSIIGHDLKNPMNSIIGFSDLLSENYNKYDDEKRSKFINIIRNSAHRSNELLENLLTWAQSQSNSIEYNPIRISLKKSIEEVFGLLNVQASKNGISLQSNFSVNCDVIADRNMLLTILRNLVSNAIKFSNHNSVVSIIVTPHDKFCEITVKDTGDGIPENEVEFLFDLHNKSKITKKSKSGSGLGLLLCKDFVEKQGGKIWVNSKINEGSEFTFTLPLAT
ncbi:MAG: tetratricopeptide repeat-containing sensor histidine kinase [Flavobacteriaceae bacterium]|nr:tetratricopeptide repeat-containing sensor histidine kinase [Flavobacteriaceae bacterium]